MTVADLIKKLQALPQELRVIYSGTSCLVREPRVFETRSESVGIGGRVPVEIDRWVEL